MFSRIGVLIFTVYLMLSTSLFSQEENYATVMMKVAQKKAEILREIDGINLSEIERPIINELDSFWHSDSINSLFNSHYTDVKYTLENIVINKKYGNMDVVGAQYGSIIDDGKLTEITKQYISDAMLEIQPLQEKLMEDVFSQFEKFLDNKNLEVEKQLAEKFDKSISDRFQYYPQTFISLSPHFVDKSQVENNISIETKVGKAGLAGAAILIMRKKIVKIVGKKIVAKMGGKALTKLIPGIGWALLALEVADAANAKNDFEKQLRTMFLKEYENSMKPMVVWSNNREHVLKKFSLGLNNWLTNQKQVIQDLLEAATLMEKPSFRNYAENRLKEGAKSSQIASELKELNNSFGRLSQQLTVEEMYGILASLPVGSKRSLIPAAINTFGDEFIVYYKKYTTDFLKIIYIFNPQNAKYLIKNDYDIHKILNQFTQYLNPKSSNESKNGFFILIKNHIPVPEGMSEEIFKDIYVNKKLVSEMYKDNIKFQKIKEILSHKETINTANILYDKDPILAKEFLKTFSVMQIISRYADTMNLNAFIELYKAYYQSSTDKNAQDMVDMVLKYPKLVSVFTEYGKDGVLLYKHYITKNSGAHQQELADKALALYHKGYEIEKLYNQEYLDSAYTFSSIPFGKYLFKLFYPVIQAMGTIGFLIVLIIMIGLIVFGLKIILSLRRSSNKVTEQNTAQYEDKTITVKPIDEIRKEE